MIFSICESLHLQSLSGEDAQAHGEAWLSTIPISRFENTDFRLFLSIGADVDAVELVDVELVPFEEDNSSIRRIASVTTASREFHSSSRTAPSPSASTGLTRSKSADPSAIRSHAPVVAQDAVTPSWKLEEPLPLKNFGGKSWFVQFGTPNSSSAWKETVPGSFFHGVGTLKFKICLTDVASGPPVPSRTFSVAVDDQDPSSKVIFTLLGNATHVDNWLEDSYASLVQGIWLSAAAAVRDGTAVYESDDQRVYDTVWEHGLLLTCINHATSSSNKRLTPLVASSAMGKLLARIKSDPSISIRTAADIVQLWSFVGQSQRLTAHNSRTSGKVALPESLWDFVDVHNEEDDRGFAKWVERRGTTEWWKQGSEHLFSFVQTGLLSIFNGDVRASVPSFRFVRALPILKDMGILKQDQFTGLRRHMARRLQHGELLPKNIYDSLKSRSSGNTEVILVASIVNEINTFHNIVQNLADTIGRLRAVEKSESANLLHRAAEYSAQITKHLSEAVMLGDSKGAKALEKAVAKWHEVMAQVRFTEESHDKLVESTLAGGGGGARFAAAADGDSPLFIGKERGKTKTSAASSSSSYGMFGALSRSLFGGGGKPGGHSMGDGRRKGDKKSGEKGAKAAPPKLSAADMRYGLSVFCGLGAAGFSDGTGPTSRFNSPHGILELPNGHILVADMLSNALRLVSREGNVSTVSGKRGAGHVDGELHGSSFNRPRGLALCPDGAIVVADTGNRSIRRVSPDLRFVETIVPATAGLLNPSSLAVRPDGSILVVDRDAHCIKLIEQKSSGKKWTVTVWAGTAGTQGHRDGPLSGKGSALLQEPECILLCSNGNVVFTEAGSHTVRLVDPSTDAVKTIAGTAFRTGHGDGKTALLNAPCSIVEVAHGNLLFCDQNNNCVRLLQPDGEVRTLEATEVPRAGRTVTERAEGMDATGLRWPWGLAVLQDGTVVCSEVAGNRISRLKLPEALARKFTSIPFAGLTISRIARAALRRSRYQRVLKNVRASMRELRKGTDECRSLLRQAVREIENAYLRIETAKHIVRTRLYNEELNFALTRAMTANARLRDEEVHGLVLSAPALVSLLPLTTRIEWPETLLAKMKVNLSSLLRDYVWPMSWSELDAELVALANTARVHGGLLIDAEAISTAFRSDTFHPPLLWGVLDLVDAVIVRPKAIPLPQDAVDRRYKLEANASAVRDAKRALTSWMEKTVVPKNPTAPFGEQLVDIMSTWIDVINELGRTAPKDSGDITSKDGPLACIVSLHLENFCMSKRHSALQAIKNVGSLDTSKVPPLLISAFVSSLRQVVSSNDAALSFHTLAPDHSPDDAPCLCDGQFICDNEICGKWNRNLAGSLMEQEFCMACGSERGNERGRGMGKMMGQQCPLKGTGMGLPPKAHQSLTRTHRWMLHDMMCSLIENRLMSDVAQELQQAAASKAAALLKEVDLHEEIFTEDLMQIDQVSLSMLSMEQLLETASFVWPRLVVFYTNELRLFPTWSKTATPEALSTWERLAAHCEQIIQVFRAGGEALLTGNCTLNLVQKCVASGKDIGPIFSAIGSAVASTDILSELHKQSQGAWNELRTYKELLTRFFPETEMLRQLLVVETKWKGMTISGIRTFLRITEGEVAEIRVTDSISVSPLSKIVANACDWLVALQRSQMFKLIWDEQNHMLPPATESEDATDPNRRSEALLFAAARSWKELLSRLQSGKISFQQLEHVGEVAIKTNELQWLLSTAPYGGDGSGEQDSSWRVKKASEDAEIKRIELQISSWLHLRAVHDSLPRISRSIVHLQRFVQTSGHSSLLGVRESVNQLTSMLNAGWLSFTLSQLKSLEPHSAKVPSVLVKLEDRLLEGMVGSLDLLNWLRSMPNDINFTASIEMAMGRPEMECPAELWEAAKPGQSGRPDEQKLSMLMTVRSFLHPFIYRTEELFPNVEPLLRCLDKLEQPTEHIINSIRICNELRLPLMELLGDDSDTASTNRLLQLQLPNREGHWVLRCPTLLEGSTVQPDTLLTLEYVVPKLGGSIPKRQTMGEVLEFQSTIVLAKSSQRAPETQTAIDEFISQVAWMRQLAATAVELRNAGHFSFLQFHYDVSLQTSAVGVRKEALRAKELYDRWISDVHFKRRNHYYLNFFGMTSIGNLYNLLSTSTQNDAFIADLVAAVNSDIARDPKQVKTFEERLRANFHVKMQRTASQTEDQEKEDSSPIPGIKGGIIGVCATAFQAAEAIEACGHSLGGAFVGVPPRLRPISVPSHGGHSAGADVTQSGIHVVIADGSWGIVDQILSAFCRAGFMPERQNVVLCGSQTPWEDVNNLLLLWANAHENGRSGQLYVLAGVEELPFENQRRIVSEIQELTRGSAGVKRNPLLFVAGYAEGVHLVAQYAHCRANVSPLPVEILREMGDQIQQHHCKGLQCHTAAHAGAGKTFNIRSAASTAQMTYVHIAVNMTMSPTALMERIETQVKLAGAQSQPCALHFDLAESLNDSMNPLLFEIAYLGGIADSQSGKQWLWNPNLCRLDFESAAGSNLSEKIRTLAVLPQREAVSCREIFQSTPVELQAGMGAYFSSLRNDATTTGEAKGRGHGANSFRRLQYVCAALCALREMKKFFPLDFNPDPGCVIPGSDCFDVLAEALELTKNISLHSVWNYVNVMYWQLMDMHNDESPLSAATTIDMTAKDQNRDVDIKTSIKGQLVCFASRTSKDFATRAVKSEKVPRIIALKVAGFKRYQFNDRWTRCEYDVNSQPCFELAKRKLFMYYRARQNQWVIDDSIIEAGAVFSTSANEDLLGVWSTSPGWGQCPSAKVRKVDHSEGYLGQALMVEGFPSRTIGGVPDNDNGLYIRQPDDIEEKPHYKMEAPRRHIFWQKQGNKWVICPICNEDQGAFAISHTVNIDGNWMFMPGDAEEKGKTMEYIWERPEDTAAAAEVSGQAAAAAAQQEKEKGTEEEIAAAVAAGYDVGSDMVKWNETNHECMLFSIQNHTLNFLSLNPEQMRKKMHPMLLSKLEENGVKVGEGIDQLNDRFHDILSALTNIHRTPEEAKLVMKGKYCLTGDALLKMLAIFVRVRCGIPVVLMGDCGCGKTYTMSYICEWLRVDLVSLDVHGGTSEDDILGTFETAKQKLEAGSNEVYVFLDEINTCAHMGLMTEAICRRSLNGNPLPDGIHVLAALNPYRRRPAGKGDTPGLVFQMSKGGAPETPDPMASLVYRVHPVPKTLREYIFDFGALNENTEKLYVQSMIASFLGECSAMEQKIVTALICTSQRFVRHTEQEESSVSLRDVKRTLHLTRWFAERVVSAWRGDSDASIGTSVILALAHVYWYRLSDNASRAEYWTELADTPKKSSLQMTGLGRAWSDLFKPGSMQAIVDRAQMHFCDNVDVGEGIALNAALKENLFVVIVCLLNRIPVFVVGKPGSSKTLAMQVIASNLQGKQSPCEFWRAFPAVYTFQYQCSPMSSSNAILSQYEMACRYQQHAHDSVTVLLLDEVGLAEHSPDMPLKCLHGMLVDPPIAIVGLSNWVLDPAKMNRAVLLNRTEPSKDDIKATGQSIILPTGYTAPEAATAAGGPKGGLTRTKSAERRAAMAPWLAPMAAAYHEIYTKQKGRDFIGMRDYYNLVKLIASMLNRTKQSDISQTMLISALCRNFGGKPDNLRDWVGVFCKTCFGKDAPDLLPEVRELVRENLDDPSSRHLMVLTRGGVALPLMMGCHLLDPKKTTVLIGSEFPDDVTELKLVQQINEVKLAMASGTSIVLLNHNNIYEALYDVLNQRYVNKTDEKLGKTRRMLRLAIGTRSQLCPVEDGFKIIVVVDQKDAYKKLDLPLLNRFEKQVLVEEDVLGPRLRKVVTELSNWAKGVLDETSLPHYNAVFSGYHKSAIASLVLSMSGYNDNVDVDSVFGVGLVKAKEALARVATPVAVMHSDALTSLKAVDYFRDHASLVTALQAYVLSASGLGALAVLMTHSPTSHAQLALEAAKSSGLFQNIVVQKPLQLAELNSEQQLAEALRAFYAGESIGPEISSSSRSAQATAAADAAKRPSLLIVQCDPYFCRESLINHARYVCMQMRSRAQEQNLGLSEADVVPRHVVFVVHLPPGVGSRARYFPLDFHPPWQVLFVDDLRPDDGSDASEIAAGIGAPLTTVSMMKNSALDLAVEGRLSITKIFSRDWQSALCACSVPILLDEQLFEENSYASRIKLMQRLSENPRFVKIVETAVVAVLKRNSALGADGMHMHVSMVVSGDIAGGSLRQSLVLALRSLVVQATAGVLKWLDTDFNLQILEKAEELWFALAGSQGIFDPDRVALEAKLTKNAGQALARHRETPVGNTGTHGMLVSNFPFHWRLVQILDDRSVRDALLQVVDAENFSSKHVEGVSGSIIGQDIVQLWGKHSAGYLHDYVNTTSPMFPSLDWKQQLVVYQAFISAWGRECPDTPAGIHTAIWANETPLFHVCSLLASLSVPLAVRDAVLSSYQALTPPAPTVFSELPAPVARIAVLSSVLLAELLHAIWLLAESAVHSKSGREFIAWVERVEAIAVDVDQLLLQLELMAVKFPDVNHGPARGWAGIPGRGQADYGLTSIADLRQRWTGILIVRIVAQESLISTASLNSESCTALLRMASRPQPLSLTFLQEFVDRVSRCCANASQVSHSLRRYSTEILFGGEVKRWGASTVDSGIPEAEVEAGIISVLVQLVCGFEHALPSLPPGTLTSHLRRALLLDLAPVKKQRVPSNLLLSTDGKLQLDPAIIFEDVFEDVSGIHSNLRPRFTRECTALLLRDLETDIVKAGESTVTEYLLALLAARCTMWEYCEETRFTMQIIGKLEPETVSKDPAATAAIAKVVSILTREGGAFLHLLKSPLAYVLLFKSARLLGGVDLIADIVSAPAEMVPWLPIDKERAARELAATTTVPDPFPWMGNTKLYRDVAGAVRSCMTGSLQGLTDLTTLTRKKGESLAARIFGKTDTEDAQVAAPEMVLAAVFSQGALVWEELDQKGLRALQEWITDYGQNVLSTTERGLVSWISSGSELSSPLKSECFRAHGENRAGKSILFLQRQIAVHAALRAIQRGTESTASALLFNPESQSKSYIPSMPDDELAVMAALMPEVGWYKCPNGHPYSVGQCTRPMQVGKCINCGAKIGGENHVSVGGVTHIGQGREIDTSTPGYLRDSTRGDKSEDINRPELSAVTIRMLRLLVHSLLSVTLSGLPASAEAAAKLVLGPDARPDVDRAASEIGVRIQEDWVSLRTRTGLSDGDLALAVHMVLSRAPMSDKEMPAIFKSRQTRNAFEVSFQQQAVQQVFTGEIMHALEKVKEELQGAGRVAALRSQLGPVLWDEVNERERNPADKLPPGSVISSTSRPTLTIWRARLPVSLRHFVGNFERRAENVADFPLIAAFLREESKLRSIKCISSILQWHRVIFTVFGQHPISREEAEQITNEMVVARLPESKQKWGTKVLEDFCNDFNAAFPYVCPNGEYYNVCTQNQFITGPGEHGGVVNLGGGNLRGRDYTFKTTDIRSMDPTVPLIYSLPSRAPLPGDTDPDMRTLCTVRTLEVMCESHNKLVAMVEKLETARSLRLAGKTQDAAAALKELDTVTKKQKPIGKHKQLQPMDLPESAVSIAESALKEGKASEAFIPATTYLTSSELVNSILIQYQREEVLLPVLSTFAQQELHYAEGTSLSYDFAEIEKALARGVFAGLQQLNLHIRFFLFRGETSGAGTLSVLKQRLPQEELPASAKEDISAEIDTVAKVSRLSNLIDSSISFLVAVGGSGNKALNGNTTLKEFVLQTLLVHEQEWEAASTPTISRMVRLRHLQSLFLLLDQQTNSSRLDDVDPKYKDEMPTDIEAKLRKAAPKMDLSTIRSIIYDCIAVYPGLFTQNNPNIPPETSLKEMITWSTEVDVEGDTHWFQLHFPDEILAAHALHAYRVLMEIE